VNSDRPFYLRIADKLRAMIVTGELSAGDRLPSIPELMASENVSDVTARRAIRILVTEGLAKAKPGSGTYVLPRPQVQKLTRTWPREASGGSPFRAEMAALGKKGTWDYVTDTVQAPPEVRERLALPEPVDDEPDVVRTSYLFKADGEPARLSTSWEPYELTRGTPAVFPEDGPYAGLGVVERMRAIGVIITHAVEEVAPRQARPEEAERLGIPAGAIVAAVLRTYWADDRPVETADIIIPADRYRLVYAIPVRED
jgi:GntR family transcriptional regulator